MPDYLEPVAGVQGETGWPAMLHDLEKRVELLSDALEGVKLSMRRLVMAEPWLTQGVPADSPTPLASYEQDAREAVRRAAEESQPQTPAAESRDDTADFVTEQRPEVAWITVPHGGSTPEPLPVIDEAPAEFVDNEEAREAVRRAVEQAKAEMNYVAPSPADAAPADDEEAKREAVRRTVEQAKGGLGFGWGAVAPSTAPLNNEEDSREAVRRAVEEAKAERISLRAPAEPQDEPAEDDETSRDAVGRAVEEADAEIGFAAAPNAPSPAPVEDEEAAREAVRQAVLQARAELASDGGPGAEAPKPVEVAPAYVVPPPHRPERVHPPTITIEDPEGRVELARVYNLLKRLDVAANSSLLNYSARQVSVQLSDSRTAPEGDNVGDAVRDVFERENDVSVDGLNVIVKLGNDYIRAA